MVFTHNAMKVQKEHFVVAVNSNPGAFQGDSRQNSRSWNESLSCAIANQRSVLGKKIRGTTLPGSTHQFHAPLFDIRYYFEKNSLFPGFSGSFAMSDDVCQADKDNSHLLILFMAPVTAPVECEFPFPVSIGKH